MKPNVQNSELGLYRQSKSSIYSLLDNDKYEKIYVPINPNTLTYIDKEVELAYSKQLYLDQSEQHFSSEFQMQLIYFYLLVTLIFVALISFTLALYGQEIYSTTEFCIHLSILLFLLINFYTLLYWLWKSTRVLLLAKVLFTCFAVCFNSYLILCDNKILRSFISVDYESDSGLAYNLPFILLTILCRSILNDDFLHYLIIVAHGCLLFFSVNIPLSPFSLPSRLFEIVLILLIFIYNLIESHMNCIRSRVLFWHKYSEEKILGQNQEHQSQFSSDFETETEHLMFICDKVRTDIKFVIKAIIYKDIKQRLKDSLASLQKIKRLIGHGNIGVPLVIEKQIQDLEDREFIQQNYKEVSLSSQGDFHRSSTIVNFMGHKNFAASHDYGIQELTSVLEGLGKNWSFDIWFIHETTGRSISIVGNYLVNKLGLLARFNINQDVMDKYLRSIEFHYKDCPYHNACHGADVLHSLMYFYINSEIQKCLNPIETLASIFAALGHDVSHPGVTSRYLITSRDSIAIQFNDISVLENMHCATIFQLMDKNGQDVFEFLNNDDWICSRRIIIEMVLATDMGKHFEILGKFRTRTIILNDLTYDKFEDKLIIFSTALKASDIGHSAKYNDLHQKWSKLVMEEFFRQGDLEKSKGLPVSMYCDRTTTNMGKSQAGFLRNICLPLYEVWVKFLNNENVSRTLEELKKNIEFWDVTHKARRSTQPISSDFVVPLDPNDSYAGSHN